MNQLTDWAAGVARVAEKAQDAAPALCAGDTVAGWLAWATDLAKTSFYFGLAVGVIGGFAMGYFIFKDQP